MSEYGKRLIVGRTYQRHIWIICLNRTESLAGSDCTFSFSISISYMLDASSTPDVSVMVRAQSKEEQTVDPVAALLESVYLSGSKRVVVF